MCEKGFSYMVALYITLVVLALVAVYFAFEAANAGRDLTITQRENDEMRGRIMELAGEVRRLRDASGLPSQIAQTPDDELMPLRTANRAAPRTQPRAQSASGTVVLVSGDVNETGKLRESLAANGYEVLTAPLTEALRHAHEMNTAGLFLDLRDTATATSAPTLLSALAADPLAKEMPVFALVASALERERLVDEGAYSGAFVVPADAAIVASSLGAAIIRRKTRARRQEAGRLVAAAR